MKSWLDLLWERLDGAGDVSLLGNARKRFLTFTAALTVLIATVWVALTAGSVIEGRPFVALLCGLAPIVFAPFPYLTLRSNISLDLLSHAYLITLYAVATLTAGTMGGAVSTTSFFLMLLPLLGTLLFGIRVGLAWVAIVAATFVALHLARTALPPSTYEALGQAPFDWMPMQEVSFWNAAMITLLSLAAALSVANFRAIVGKSSALLTEAAHRTEDARQAQHAAEALARSKSEFMANVSHELRTPLNAVIGYSEMLIEGAEERGVAEDADDNRKVLEAAIKLRGMINDVLKLAAIDAGRLAVEIEACRPGELALEALESVAPLLHSRSNAVRIEDLTAPGIWFTDGDKVGLCLRSLLANAAHCCANGRIELRISQGGAGAATRLVIDVEDPGPPVDPDRIELLFEPFTQPDSVGVRHYEGMALSLALARRIARLLDGELSVSNREGNAGVRFKLDIPARFAPDAASRESRAA